jgi:hypothetical protein
MHFPNPSPASHDLSKIIRPDYADPFYMTLALEVEEFGGIILVIDHAITRQE